MFNFFGKNKKKKSSPSTNSDAFVTKQVHSSPKPEDNNTLSNIEENISESSEKIQDSISETFENVKGSVENSVDNIKEAVSNAVDNMQDNENDQKEDVEDKYSNANISPEDELENANEESIESLEDDDVVEPVEDDDTVEESSEDVDAENDFVEDEESPTEENSVDVEGTEYDQEIKLDSEQGIDNGVENESTIPLFSYEQSLVENTATEYPVTEDEKVQFVDDQIEHDDDQLQMDFDKVLDNEVENEEKEVIQEIAFDIKQLINNKSYPIILTIKDSDEDIKKELTSIIGENTVFLVDLTESRNGYKIIPDSANREFAPLNNDGDSSYLDGIDIINLIKNNGDKYEGSFIIIAGIDSIADKITNALSGNQIAIDMINERVASSIQEAVDNNITVIGTGYEFNDSLNAFIENLSIDSIVEDSELVEDNDITEDDDNSVAEEEQKVSENTFTTFSVYKPESNNDVDTEPSPVENWEDEGGNTVDNYLESVGEPSIAEGLENKEESDFIDENASERDF